MLIDEIQKLITLKTEGAYWDFKEEWHSNNSDLLHDIICMANNLENRDAYVIIGVANNGTCCGVANNNRKNQQQLIDFLKDIKFAGGVRPIVYVQSIIIDEKEIDTIIIKNTYNTPYYLTDDFQGLFKGNIYTRVVDTNTPKNRNADIDKVEWLWRKRFGLVGTIESRLKRILQFDGWICEDAGEYNERFFNEHYPEVRIDPVVSEQERWESEDNYDIELAHDSFFYLYANPSFWNIVGDEQLRRKCYNIRWHGNRVYQFYTISAPRQDFDFVEPEYKFLDSKIGITLHEGMGLGANYAYFIRDGIKYSLFRMMRPLQISDDHMEKYGYFPGMKQKALCLNVIPIFEDQDEYNTFMEHITMNHAQFKSEFEALGINDMFSGGKISNDPRIAQSLKLGKLMVIWLERLRAS